jgi:methylmalonyl-CoA mutase N-terminal domain/subunit
VKRNYPQREIAEASFALQSEIDARRRIVVGVNDYTDTSDEPLDILHIDPKLERKQIDRLHGVRARRQGAQVDAALARLREAAAGEGNLMPHLLDAARVHATEGEIIQSLQQVFGTYTETPVF